MFPLKYFTGLCLLLFPLLGSGQVQTGLRHPCLQAQVDSLAQAEPYVAVVYDFLKNYADTLKSLKGTELRQRLAYDGVEVEQGGFDRFHLIDGHTAIVFLRAKGLYGVRIRKGAFPILEAKFPSSCQLLTGKTLPALEKELLEGVQGFRYQPRLDVPYPESGLTALPAKGYYVLKGNAYHLESIRSDIYLEKRKGGSFVPVFSEEHLNESIGNLLVCEDTPADVDLHLVIRQYGFKKNEVTLKMKDWIAYCRSQGCTFYWGIEALEPTAMKASVFIVNEVLSYDHVMSVEVPYTVFTDPEATVQGDVNIFIPTHNITTLFQEYDKSN